MDLLKDTIIFSEISGWDWLRRAFPAREAAAIPEGEAAIPLISMSSAHVFFDSRSFSLKRAWLKDRETKNPTFVGLIRSVGGEGGIRTHGTVSSTTV